MISSMESFSSWIEAEIVRLEEEIAASNRRQEAFERYLAALAD